MARIIPDWVYRSDPSGQSRPGATDRNATGSTPREIQATVASENTFIPIIYGGPERIAGKPYTVGMHSNARDLVVSYIVCEGEVDAIANVEMNDAAVPAGVTVTTYRGTQAQGIDPALIASVPGFDEPMRGTAYIVAQIPPGVIDGFPNLTCEVRGLRVKNPRENLVTFSNFESSTWGNYAPTALSLASGQPDPWGGNTAVRCTGLNTTGALLRIVFPSKNADGVGRWTIAMYAKLISGTTITPGNGLVMGLNDGQPAVDYGAQLVVGQWVRVEATAVAGAGAKTFVDLIDNTISDYVIDIAGLQVNRGDSQALVATNGAPVDSDVKAFSVNPALITGDFMERYARRVVNQRWLVTSADHCDVPMSNGEPRSTLTLTLAANRTVDEWIETLRGYVPAWVVEDAGEWQIRPDAVATASHAFDDSNIETEPLPRIFKRGNRDVPNVVEVAYTDTTVKPWQTRIASASNVIGTADIRKARLSLPGIRRYSQAYRFAVERLNHYTVENIEGEIAVVDNGVRVLPGEVASVTEPAFGWTAQLVRVLRVVERDNGRWSVGFRVFNSAAYSDAVQSPPAGGGGTLPDPTTIAPVTGLAAVERVYLEKDLPPSSSIPAGVVYASRFEVSWNASADPYFEEYEIDVLGANAASDTRGALTKTPQWFTSSLMQGVQYTITVRAVNSLGVKSDPASITLTAAGKLLPPGDVPSITFAQEIGGEAILRWTPAVDIDVVRYEWRVSSDVNAAWGAMTVLDRTDGLYARYRGLAPGTYKFCVKAIDSVGQYSTNAKCVTLTVTTDSAAFLNTRAFYFDNDWQRALYSRTMVPLVEGGTRKLPRYESIGSVVWDTALPSPVDVGYVLVDGYGHTGNSHLDGTSWDLGLVLEFTATIDLTGISPLWGYGYVRLDWSIDGVTWNYPVVAEWTANTMNGATPGGPGLPLPASVSWKGTARFIKPALLTYGGASAMLEGPITVGVVSQTREEAGNSASLASGPVRVNLAQIYTKAVSIDVVVNGSTFGTASVDNVQVNPAVPNSFDVYIFDSNGNQIAAPFFWTFRGV